MSDPGRAPASLVLQGLAAAESAAAVHPWVADAEDLRESPASATAHRHSVRARAAPEHRAAPEACLGPMAGQPADQAIPTTAMAYAQQPGCRRWAHLVRRRPADGHVAVPTRIEGLTFHPAPEVQAEPKTVAVQTVPGRHSAKTLMPAKTGTQSRATEAPIAASASRDLQVHRLLLLSGPQLAAVERVVAYPS